MATSEQMLQAELLRLVTAGSVDDGKSTLIGRLLYDTKQILADQLEHIEQTSERRGDGYVNLALLTDGLRAEREQGITIDVAYRSFVTARRRFQLADAPGHVQYTRNMVTGASTADVAVILLDARKGVVEQTRRHSYIASILAIPHVVVAVNKMDLVDFSEERFREIEADLQALSGRLGLHDELAIPMSALRGDNVVDRGDAMPWYDGPTLLEHLETIELAGDRNLDDRRFPVQWVIRPMADEHHDYRGYAGEVASGIWRAGDEVVVLPSGRRSRVAAVETFDHELDAAIPGQSVTIRLEDDVDVGRGDMLADPERAPTVARELTAELCWMSETPARAAREARDQAHDALRARDRGRARLGRRHAHAREHARAGAARAERPRRREAAARRAARRRPVRAQPRDRRVHPHRRGDERHRRRRDGASE